MDYCYHVKGLCRGTHKPGLFALAHATSTRGADHLRGRSWAYGENDADLFHMLVKIRMLPPQMSKNPVEAADRIYTLERAFNIRQGITRKHDRLPQKPDVKDTRQGEEELERHEKMLTEYYRVHGCDPDTGIPTREWLESMGLKYVADELDAHGALRG